ncbi:MAG: glycosyltransferase [Ignavibacteria bacterium]|jgi:glycosyltransferase involved in cell wall biosynthesis
MKIKILYSNKYPSIGAASKRIKNYEKGLSKVGVDVEVIPIPPLSQNPLLQFIVPVYTLSVLMKKKIKADILFVYGFGWVSKLLIIFYGKIKKSKIVFEVNEKPYSIRGSGRRDIVLKYFAPLNLFCLTRLVFPFADGFVVISEALKKFVEKHSSKNCAIIRIPILVDYEYYANYGPKENNFKTPFMVHTATLNDVKDGILAVFHAFILVHKKHKIPLHFYLTNRIGLTSVVNKIDNLIKENNLEDYVHFLDSPDNETLINYQANANLTVINKVDSDQNRHNFATKTGEYLALGIPIIITKIGEVVNYFNDSNIIFLEENFADRIAEKIVFVLKNKYQVEKIAEQGKYLAQNVFNYKKQCIRLTEFFNNLLYDENK